MGNPLLLVWGDAYGMISVSLPGQCKLVMVIVVAVNACVVPSILPCAHALARCGLEKRRALWTQPGDCAYPIDPMSPFRLGDGK